tara:strand:- start:24 stop:251 length:228 start_codon:yes stop_codon:yes gene_type:complete
VARLKIENLYKITDSIREQFLYALLAEEGAELEARPYGEGFMELLLVMNPEGNKLPREFLSEKLTELGWDIYGGD